MKSGGREGTERNLKKTVMEDLPQLRGAPKGGEQNSPWASSVCQNSWNTYGFRAPGGPGTRTLEARAGKESSAVPSSWLTCLPQQLGSHITPHGSLGQARRCTWCPGGSLRYVHPKLLFASIPALFCSDSNFLSLSPPVSLCSLETASFAKMSFSYGNFSVPLCLNLIYPTLEFLVSISDCTPSLSSLKAQLIFHIFHVPQVLNTWPCTEYIPKLFL